RLARRLRLVPAASERQLFWDTPVPYEHSFECTWDNVEAMCRSYLELERAWGVSLGGRFPGWGQLLQRLAALSGIVPRLDRLVMRRPRVADYVVSVWRPRPRAEWPAADELRVRPTNPVHQRLIAEEAQHWAGADFKAFFARAIDATREMTNQALTG